MSEESGNRDVVHYKLKELERRHMELVDVVKSNRRETFERIDERVSAAVAPMASLQDAVNALNATLSEIAPQVKFTVRFWKWIAGIIAAILAAVIASWIIASAAGGQ